MTVPVAIPLAALPSQTVAITLGNQPCRIQVYQKSTGLYFDLYVNDTPIVVGVLCLNATFMIIDRYFGFTGDFVWADTQGESDPDYTGLPDRFALLWVA